MTLRLLDVRFAYRERPGVAARCVVDGVTMTVEPGITAVIGPNGSGKSTMLRLMLGLLRPNAGTVLWDDTPAHRLSAATLAQRCAYIPQKPEVSAAFTVREIVALGRFALAPSDTAVFRALDRMDVLDRRDEPFAHLSAGQQQRVVAARALAQLDPGDGRPSSLEGKFLLADEPMSALDPSHVGLMVDALRAAAGAGAAVVVVMHDLTTAVRMADRVLALEPGGRAGAYGPASEAMSPETLRRVFGVGFERLEGSGGAVLARSV